MAQQKTRPNILFVVWDACRYDYAHSHADTFADLATNNLSFENAIAPATWSLPSHASLFTGEYPSSHGSTRMTDSIDSTPLVGTLQDEEYTCYSVSGNGFASQRTGFHEPFDEAYYTGGEEPFLDGLGIYNHVQTQRLDGSSSRAEIAYSTLRSTIGHSQPFRSLLNLAAVGAGHSSRKVEPLQRIPHPIFSDDNGYNFSPEQHTGKIEDLLHQETRSEEPFFLFTNYMSTHRPYKPSPDLQSKHLGERLSHEELIRINREIASPWDFIERTETVGVDERDLKTLRGLYAGEVETVDAYLNRVLKTLEHEGLREDTIVIVTSDHGENLGEVDAMGRQRIGHEASMSEHLLRVPLVIAHPELDGRNVEEYVSLKDIFGLVTEGRDELLGSAGTNLGPLSSSDGLALSEYPAVGGEQLYEKHPGISHETIDYRVTEDAVAAYAEKWKVVMESNGETYAWHATEKEPFEDAPAMLREPCQSHLKALGALSGGEGDLSRTEVEQLEALGYL